MMNLNLASIETQNTVIYPSMVKDYSQPVYIGYGNMHRIFCISKNGIWGSTWVNESGFNRDFHYFIFKDNKNIDSFIDEFKKGVLVYSEEYTILGISPFNFTDIFKNLIIEISLKALPHVKKIKEKKEEIFPIIEEINFWKRIKNKFKKILRK